jgi:hypothetical protein
MSDDKIILGYFWLFGIWLQAWVVCDCKTAGS